MKGTRKLLKLFAPSIIKACKYYHNPIKFLTVNDTNTSPSSIRNIFDISLKHKMSRKALHWLLIIN